MENNTRIALIGIIVEKEESAEPLNHLLWGVWAFLTATRV